MDDMAEKVFDKIYEEFICKEEGFVNLPESLCSCGCCHGKPPGSGFPP